MKRLIAQIGLTYLSVLAVVFYFGKVCAYIVLAISLLIFLLLVFYKTSRKTIYLPVMAFVSILACVVNICYSELVYEPIINKYDGYNGTVIATLVEEPQEYYGSYKYVFKTKPTDSFDSKIKFTIYDKELLNIEPFDVVKMEIELYESESASNISQKCFLTGDLGYSELRFTVIDTERGFYYYAIKLRQFAREVLKNNLSEASFEFCSALLVGDKFALSEDVYEMFRQAGVTHLIVVSGMHFSTLASVFLWLSGKYYRYRHWFLSACVLFVVLYMAVTGLSASVVRSGVMILIYCLGVAISRQSYPLNSLGIAAITVTCSNPYAVGDVGLILSFATTFAIITVTPKLYDKFAVDIKNKNSKSQNELKRWLRNKLNQAIKGTIMLLCMNVSAFIVSLPLTIVFFDSFSVVSIVATFVLNIPVTVLLYLSAIAVFVCKVPFLGSAVLFLVDVFTRFTLRCVEFFSSLPFAYFTVTDDYVYLWLVMCCVLFGMMLLCCNKTAAVKAFTVSVIVILLAGFVTNGLLSEKVTALNVFDVGSGTAVVYTDSEVSAVIELDCSNCYISETIEKIEQMTDNVHFVSSVSDTKTSVNSLYSLTKVFAISDVLLYDTKRSVEVDSDIDVATLSGNIIVNLSDNVSAVYHQTEDGYIIYFSANGSTTLILPPYIDASNIPEIYRQADNIVMNNSPLNAQLLSCDTLIISADESYSKHIMKFTDVSYNRVLLTSDSDIEIVEVV